MPIWKRIDDPDSGYAYSLSDAMSLLDWRFPGRLQPVSNGRMIIVSDYSGQHRRASHEAYTFLITTESELERWIVERDRFRKQWLPDGRRLSFKELRDGMKWRSIFPFLEVAFGLRGNLVTVLIDQKVGSFFGGNTTEMVEIYPDCFPNVTPNGTVEKMVRLATIQAMLLVGFRGETQPSWWISDNDETLDTHDKREGLGRLASYFTYGFSKWKQPAENSFGTTGFDSAPSWAEDLAAIPDMLAGTLNALSNVLPKSFDGQEVSTRVVSSKSAENDRARQILTWVGEKERPLRNILLRMERNDSDEVRASYQFIVRNIRSQ